MGRLSEGRSVQIVRLLKQTGLEWYQSRTFELGAALAFYAIFSIAPVIVLAFTAASLVLGKEAAQGRVTQEIESTVGHTVAVAIQATAQYTYQSGSGVPATVLSIVFFGFGATGLFRQLQSALNAIWEVEAQTGAGTARNPARSVRIVPGRLGNQRAAAGRPAGHGGPLPRSARSCPPRPRLKASRSGGPSRSSSPGHSSRWPSRWSTAFCPTPRSPGATFGSGRASSGLLFLLGNHLIGWYLAAAGVTSVYGAAGSIVIVLLWVYYSSQVVLFGAEFTRVYAKHRGSPLEPKENAVRVNPKGACLTTQTRSQYSRPLAFRAPRRTIVR